MIIFLCNLNKKNYEKNVEILCMHFELQDLIFIEITTCLCCKLQVKTIIFKDKYMQE